MAARIDNRLWAAGFCAMALASAARPQEVTPTGQILTPTAAPGAIFQPLNPGLKDDPGFTAGQAAAVAVSPDGRTLLIVTSGFNRAFGPDGKFIADRSREYVFVWDVSGAQPVQRQAIAIDNAFLGLAWAPRGDRFFVSGGVDDRIVEYLPSAAGFAPGRSFALGHKAGLGLRVRPEAAGVAISPDGGRLLAANIQNDSVSLIDLATGAVTEHDLRPGVIDPARSGEAGGTFPRAVAWTSDGRAYVASERDREIIALEVTGGTVKVAARIATVGQPIALLKGVGARLFAALDNTDSVAVIDTRVDRIVETIPTAGPAGWKAAAGLGGAGSNALALSPDGGTLLVSNGGENAVAVVKLDAAASGAAPAKGRRARHRDADDDGDDDDGPAGSAVVGLIPTGWYPTGVAVRPDGGQL